MTFYSEADRPFPTNISPPPPSPPRNPHAHPLLSLTTKISPNLEALITTGLNTFNDQATGYADHQALAIIARDPETNAILGGALRRSFPGLIFLDLLHLPDSCQGAGAGTESSASSNRKAAALVPHRPPQHTQLPSPRLSRTPQLAPLRRIPGRPKGASRNLLSNQL